MPARRATPQARVPARGIARVELHVGGTLTGVPPEHGPSPHTCALARGAHTRRMTLRAGMLLRVVAGFGLLVPACLPPAGECESPKPYRVLVLDHGVRYDATTASVRCQSWDGGCPTGTSGCTCNTYRLQAAGLVIDFPRAPIGKPIELPGGATLTLTQIREVYTNSCSYGDHFYDFGGTFSGTTADGHVFERGVFYAQGDDP